MNVMILRRNQPELWRRKPHTASCPVKSFEVAQTASPEKLTAGTGVNPRNPVPAAFWMVRYKLEGETQETNRSPRTYVR
jgi:hypothetical protein